MRWLWSSILCLSPLVAWGVELNWTYECPVEGLAGYEIHAGSSPGQYDTVIQVRDPAATSLSIDIAADTYFAMKAYNTSGERSEFSAEICLMPDGCRCPTQEPPPPVLLPPGAVSMAATWSWEEHSTGPLSVSAENISAARADPITRQITVPPGTTTAVALIAYYPARNVVSASLGGAPPHAQSILPNNDSMGFLVWNSPPAGPQSLVIDYSGGISAGTTAHMIYVTGAKPYSGKYAQGVVAGAGQAVATISGIAPSWLVIRFESLYNQGVPVLADGWTDLGVTGPDATLYGRASFRFAGGDSVTARTANVAYPTLQILAFEPL